MTNEEGFNILKYLDGSSSSKSSSTSSVSCCACLYFVCEIVAFVLYFVYDDGISDSCAVDFHSWWIWSFVLNFLPPLLVVLSSCLLICTGIVNCLSVAKHANDEIPEGEHARLIGGKTKTLNILVLFVMITMLLVIFILTILAFAWLIVGTVWIVENADCLDSSIYGLTIYWIVVQYLFLSLTILGALLSCCLFCCVVGVTGCLVALGVAASKE